MSAQSGTFPPKAASRDRLRWRQRHELLRTGEHLLTYGLLFIVAIFVLLPLMWAFAASFTPNAKVFEYAFPFSLRALFPVDFTLEAYEALFARGFGNALKNSFWLSGVTVVLGGSINALAGFAFARFEFRGKRILFLTVILLPFLVPVDLTAIPRFILVNSLDWRNTWQALIVPGLGNSLAIFLFRQFFEEIPQDLIDAARVDGASWWRLFFNVVLPLSRPVLITAALFLFLQQWDAYFWPLLVAPRPNCAWCRWPSPARSRNSAHAGTNSWPVPCWPPSSPSCCCCPSSATTSRRSPAAA